MSGERDATAIAISSHASILRDCASTRDLTAAKQAQWEIARDGFGGDRYLGNLLVQAYGKCGSVRDAREVFDRIQRRNIFSWTIMLGAYADNGHGREALGLMYGKCGHLEEAKAVFATLVERNRVSWNAMLAAYAQNGHCEEAVRLYRLMCFEGIKPDATTFVSVLDGWKGEGEHGRRIHDQVVESGFGSNTTLANALVSMYGSGGRVDDARYVFDGIAEKTVVSWNAMLTAYAQNGRYGEAVDLFWKMDVAPDTVSFVNVLGACMDIEEGRLVHEHIKASGFPVGVLVSTSLVNMYGRFLRLEEAKQCFEQARERDRVCWNSMVGAYAQNGCMEEAKAVFDRVASKDIVLWTALLTAYSRNEDAKGALLVYRNMDLEGMEKNRFTFSSIVSVCADAEALAEGQKVHLHTVSVGYDKDVIVGTTLVDFYSKCHDVDTARSVFDGIEGKDIVTWNVMITGFVRNGHGREAVRLYQKMDLPPDSLTMGIMPDELTFLSVLFACSHGGSIQQGLDLFLSAGVDYGIATNTKHYVCVVDILGRVGRLEEAQEVLNRMPFQANDVAWMTLLGACRIHRDFEQGRRAADYVIELDPQNAAPYALLSTMFSAAGRGRMPAKG
ncbi:hypothetical protein SELMODRAFT_94945 [Selaginella moellendorffii]|uniref:Pentacotripeptide-repeat region of PRORP domain-containing protein n=1 Tax=Selaginella moellendorffii TaxID=88036 RepID=D8RJM3_SELML|nr:hypothetical protein SELMODRAFT_94945 [Selaginella moellendorffii]